MPETVKVSVAGAAIETTRTATTIVVRVRHNAAVSGFLTVLAPASRQGRARVADASAG
jgi:hypothetical protein